MRTINRDTRKSVSTREIARYSGGAMQVVPRGRIELPTPAFSGPRSTGELPRHRGEQRFYGKATGQEREKHTLYGEAILLKSEHDAHGSEPNSASFARVISSTDRIHASSLS